MTDQKILKAILMLRRLGNRYQTKEEQIAEQKKWLAEDPTYAERIDEWIDSMREDLAKTPEQREEESRQFIEELSQREWELAQQEMAVMRHERDEWDDFWDDRARSVGAVNFI